MLAVGDEKFMPGTMHSEGVGSISAAWDPVESRLYIFRPWASNDGSTINGEIHVFEIGGGTEGTQDRH